MNLVEHEKRIKDIERLDYLRDLQLLDSPAEEAYDRLTSLAARIFHVPISLVSLVDADRQYFKSFVGLSGDMAETRQTSLEYSFCQYAVSSRQPLIVDDARQHPILKDNLGLTENNVVAYAGIPLVTSDGVALGAFCIVENQPRHWSEAEIGVLRDLAQAVMTEIELRHEVLERQAVEADLRRQVDMLSRLTEFNNEVGHKLNVSDVLRVALNTALRLSRAQCGYLGLVEEGAIRLAQWQGDYSETAINDYMQSKTSVVARVLHTRIPEHIQDVDNDPDYVALIPDTRAKIVIPLVSRGNLLGVLNLETPNPGYFDADIFSFLQVLAARVAVAVDNAHLYEMLEHKFEELSLAHAKLSHLEQLKTDIIRIAAHDLRNPIGIITGYLHLLDRTVTPATHDEITPLLEPIAEAAERMHAITDNILSLQRVEALAADGASCVDLTRIVCDAYAGLAASAGGKSLDFHLDAPADALDVRAESAYLTEAVANLINNAIKYTPTGGAVTVRLTSDAHRAVFNVTDTGCGVPESAQQTLFQPFKRVRTEETAGIEGTGLGLYLVKQVIERFGGDMHFESTYRHGSTFGFTLPLAEEPAARS